MVTPTGKLSSRDGSAPHTDWAASSRRRPRRQATPTAGAGPDADSGFAAALRSPSSALAFAGMQVGAGSRSGGSVGGSGRASCSRDGSHLLQGLEGLAADLASHAPSRGHAGQPPPGAWQPPSPSPHAGPDPGARRGSDSLDSFLDLSAPWDEAPRTPPFPRIDSPTNSLGGLSGGSAAPMAAAALATAGGQWHLHEGHQAAPSPDRVRRLGDRGGGGTRWDPGVGAHGLHGARDGGRPLPGSVGPNSWALGAAPPSVYSEGSEAFPRFGRAGVPSLDIGRGQVRACRAGPACGLRQPSRHDTVQAPSPSMRAAGSPAHGAAAGGPGLGGGRGVEAARRQRRRRHGPATSHGEAGADAGDDGSSAPALIVRLCLPAPPRTPSHSPSPATASAPCAQPPRTSDRRATRR